MTGAIDSAPFLVLVEASQPGGGVWRPLPPGAPDMAAARGVTASAREWANIAVDFVPRHRRQPLAARSIRKTLPLCIVSATLALLPGCVLPDYVAPAEVTQVTGIAVVDLRHRPERMRRLEGRAAAFPALMVSFKTAEPLRTYMARIDRLLHLRASLCTNGGYDGGRQVSADYLVYDSLGPVGQGDFAPPADAEREVRAFLIAKQARPRERKIARIGRSAMTFGGTLPISASFSPMSGWSACHATPPASSFPTPPSAPRSTRRGCSQGF